MKTLWIAIAPVQGDGSHPPGTVAWSEHLSAWEAYRAKYGNDQSAARIADRGGFSYGEIAAFLGHAPATWEPKT